MNWKKAIAELRYRGYAISLEKGKLRYQYKGKDTPQDIAPLLKVLKAHKAEIQKDTYFLLEQAIQEINSMWKPGTLDGVSPEVMEQIRGIEAEINRATLADDVEVVRRATGAYKDIFEGILKVTTAEGTIRMNQNASMQGKKMYTWRSHTARKGGN